MLAMRSHGNVVMIPYAALPSAAFGAFLLQNVLPIFIISVSVFVYDSYLAFI